MSEAQFHETTASSRETRKGSAVPAFFLTGRAAVIIHEKPGLGRGFIRGGEVEYCLRARARKRILEYEYERAGKKGKEFEYEYEYDHEYE